MGRVRGTNGESGVTIVESALLIGLVFTFTLNLVDIARFIMLEAILNKAADDGLNVATKISNFDYDVRDLDISDRRRVLEAATRFPLETFFTPPGTPSDAELIAFEHIDRELAGAGNNPPSITRAALVVRPGEVAYQQGDPSKFVTNAMRAPDPDNKLPAPPWSMRNSLRSNPIHVEIRAKVKPLCPRILCPWFGTERIMSGRALGWRENSIPRGPLRPQDPADLPSTFASSSYVTTTTVGLAPVTTLPPSDPTGMNWERAFERTATGRDPKRAYCPGSPFPVVCLESGM
jgi:hypothetical protein